MTPPIGEIILYVVVGLGKPISSFENPSISWVDFFVRIKPLMVDFVRILHYNKWYERYGKIES